MPPVHITSATPILYVERIEPCLTFWEGLGFKETTAVPHGDHRGFSALSNGKIELMYQTFASLADDIPALVDAARASKAFLFIQVESLSAVKEAVKQSPVYLKERQTFYGATEIGVRDPAGHHVTFAQFAP
jgi:uncharacterized glyoxalase superfamily protein PhnB